MDKLIITLIASALLTMGLTTQLETNAQLKTFAKEVSAETALEIDNQKADNNDKEE